MRSPYRKKGFVPGIIAGILVIAAVWSNGTEAFAQLNPPPLQELAPAPEPLVWDSLQKELTVKPGEAMANFVFTVTNTSDSEAVINHVQTSCGCTVAKIPSQPWRLAPHTSGEMGISVNLAGKSGTIFKTVTVFSTNPATKLLVVKVIIPEPADMTRSRNQSIAFADRQAVFKGDCARCHFEPAKGKLSADLYAAACGICHEANPRATMVSNLHALNHPTDYVFWKQWITNGKPGSLMPAFAANQGGPLTGEQIDSLAKTLAMAVPAGNPVTPVSNAGMAQPAGGNLPVMPPVKN